MKYPTTIQIRLANEDKTKLDQMSESLDLPKSTLLRRAWREWLLASSENLNLVK